MVEDVFDRSTFTKNRERMLKHEVTAQFFIAVVDQARNAGLMSSDHFSVDGTLIRAWASHKSFVPKDGPPPDKTGSSGNPEVDFKRQKRSNDTHASITDPDARLATKSNTGEAIPAYVGTVLMENRAKLAVETRLMIASGIAEREAAIEMLRAALAWFAQVLGETPAATAALAGEAKNSAPLFLPHLQGERAPLWDNTSRGVFARLETPVDFDSLDDLPVDLIFLLLAPEGAGADHLKALSRIARVLRDSETTAKIRGTRDAAAIHTFLSQAPASNAA
jgi:mannitol/fructose-specific phosphotransferase system IIA component